MKYSQEWQAYQKWLKAINGRSMKRDRFDQWFHNHTNKKSVMETWKSLRPADYSRWKK